MALHALEASKIDIALRTSFQSLVNWQSANCET